MEPLSRLRRIRVLIVGVVLGLAALAGVLATRGSAGPVGPTFAPPVYVDQDLAGGEPTVFADSKNGTLIYTAHEGTTHLYRDGITSSPWGDFAPADASTTQASTSSTTRSSHRLTAARPGTRGTPTAMTATGRGLPVARRTRSSWRLTPSKAAAVGTRCSSPTTVAIPAAPPGSTTTGRFRTGAPMTATASSTTTS